MKIFINDYKWKVQPRNTDWQYLKNFYSLEKLDGSLEIRGNNNSWCNLKANFLYCLIVLLSKIPLTRNWHFIKEMELKAFISKSDCQWADIILTHGSIPNKTYGTPLVFNSGFMTDEFCGRCDRKEEVILKSSLFEQATKVTLSSVDAVKRFNSHNNKFRGKLVAMPFLLPYLKMSEQNIVNEVVEVLFVGRDGKRKGLDNLCKSIDSLKDDLLEKARFTFVTDDKVTLDDKVFYKVLKDCTREKVNELMNAADIFVMPTLHESYGLVFIEAMAKGCAIIADNKQPRLELFRNGECALLVDPKSVNKIAEAIKTLIIDKEQRETISNLAKQQFDESFSFEVVGKKYLKLFKECVHAAKN